jgi:hypothetical protein
MKKLILTAALGLAVVSAAFAQGTINFASAAPGAVFVTSNTAGVKATGAGYLADFYYGANGSTEGQLTALGLPATFNTGAQAGYFTGGARTIPGFGGGTTIEAQVRVWQSTFGPTYDLAAAAGGEVGKSSLFTVTLATPPGTPQVLNGLNGTFIVASPVPEPTTFAMAGLGLASMLILRRRK